jgi:uncharacterized membrane protein
MNPEKKFNLLLALVAVFFSIFFVILIVGAIVPGEYVFAGAPWYVWAAIGDILAFIISVFVSFGIVEQKNNKTKK